MLVYSIANNITIQGPQPYSNFAWSEADCTSDVVDGDVPEARSDQQEAVHSWADRPGLDDGAGALASSEKLQRAAMHCH